jgi:hypothetical protein
MKKLIEILSFIFLMVLPCSLLAGTIVITPDTQTHWTDTVNDPPNEPSITEIEDIVGAQSGSLSLLYKGEAEGEEGAFSASYETTFYSIGENSDPNNAYIVYQEEESSIEDNPLYLLVKDGNSEPTYYLFNLLDLYLCDTNNDGEINSSDDPYQWNGIDTISLENFWPGPGGAISNVGIYGAVPDGGLTIFLLGIGMGGLAFFSRKFRV